MQSVDRDCTSVLSHYCAQFGHFKRNCPLEIKHQQKQRQQPVRHHQQQQHGQHQQKPRGRRQNNGGGGGGLCGVHTTRQRPITTPTAVSNSIKPTATLMWPPPESSASKESAASTTCPRRTTSQNAPTSPSRQPRYKARQSRQRRPGRRTAPGRLVY